MITLLTGKDIFAKQQYLTNLLGKYSNATVQRYGAGDVLPEVSLLSGQSLFGDSVVYIFDGCFSNLSEEFIKAAPNVSVPVILLEDTLDKRLTKVKEFLNNAAITVKEFTAPDSSAAAAWLVAHAKELGGTLDSKTAYFLASQLMGETQMVLPVLRAHQELQKLISLAGGEPITVDMITALVVSEAGIDVFKLMDAISAKRRSEAMQLLSRYYETSPDDEKSATIRLVALLADQWRNAAIVKDLSDKRMPDDTILKRTGWKSGKLFMMKKVARNYELKTLVAALQKLSHLDSELKTSTLPGRVIVDMIITML